MSTEHVPPIEEQSDPFQELLESLAIPPNIDPRLLALWIERERDEWEKKQQTPKIRKKDKLRGLGASFAAFIGIVAMCLTILLGLVQGAERPEILTSACQAFLIYTIIGYLAGLIAEYCVADSVETLLRDIIRRGHEAGMAESEGVKE